MTIRPLDLQTNFSQMHEVGRAEQARNTSILAQQTLMDDQATKQMNLRKERLDESEKSDQTNFRDVLSANEEKGKKDRNKQDDEKNNQNQDDENKPKYSSDQRFGRFLDVVR